MGNLLNETGERNAIFLGINGKELPPSQFKLAIHFIQIHLHIARICELKSGVRCSGLSLQYRGTKFNSAELRKTMNGGNILIMASKEWHYETE